MRAISRNAARALIDNGKFKQANTETFWGRLKLHNSVIAWKIDEDTYEVTLAGYNTLTTRERLNTLLTLIGSPVRFSQKKSVAHFNGHRLSNTRDIITIKQGIPVKIEPRE